MKFLISISLFFILLFDVKAQNIKNSTINKDYSKHSFNIELFGKGLWFESLSYEYNIKPKIAIGTGLGIHGFLRGKVIRSDNNNVSEIGNYTETSFFIPTYIMYKVGKRKSHLLISAGSSFFTFFYYNNFPSEKTLDYDIYIAPFASLGYEYMPNKFFYRINIYAEYIGDNSWFPSVIPWLGFSFGRKI